MRPRKEGRPVRGQEDDMIQTKVFGHTKDGREVLAFTLTDGEAHVTVLNYGGILQSIVVPDREGRPTDVALGYPDVAGYENNGGYLGALIGRFGNRIAKGRLTIDGKEYALYINDRGNHLHGGKEGFNSKIWAHEIAGDVLRLTLLSPDGEENYPGTLSVTVEYTFRDKTLKIAYRAETDKKTAVNLTNHVYFNLGGEGKGDVLGHILTLSSDRITPTDSTMIPSGGFRAVKGTPFDFNAPKTIGKDIGADDEDLKNGNGYDHCYMLHNKCGEFVEYATVECPETGIRMICGTDMPAVQLYAGNGLAQEGKSGYYAAHGGFCLETQEIPNNVNVPEYAACGDSILSPGEVYSFSATYRFEK